MAIDPEQMQAYVVGGLVALFGVLSFLLIEPFLYYLLGGILLAYLFYPVHRRIEERVGQETIAATVSLLIILVAAVIPTIYLTTEVVMEGQQALDAVGEGATTYLDVTGTEALVHDLTGMDVNVEAQVRQAFREAGRFLSSEFPGLISTVLDALIGMFILGVTAYYLFKDGDEVLDSMVSLTPLSDDRKQHLMEELDDMSKAVIGGHLVTAIVQGVVMGAALYLVGIPNAVFWTFIMIVLGVLPIIGNSLVWGPAGLYLLFIEGATVPGIALLAFGTFVVTVLDNMVRAKVVGRRSKIHPLLVIMGVIGGLPLFGVLGVFLGPLVLGFLVTLLDVYRQDFLQK